MNCDFFMSTPASLPNPISAPAWLFLGLATVLTFYGFMTLDPNYSLLLAIGVTANVAIGLGVIYYLYAWNLLLSPLAGFFISAGMIIFYSWGNLGARIAGEERFVNNPNALAYYPQVALLTMMGLLLFCWVAFGLFPRQVHYQPIRYQDLYWQPWQVMGISLLAGAVVLYLSLKYPFMGGYFRGTQNHFDRWLAASYYFFIILTIMAGISTSVKARCFKDRLVALLAMAIALSVAISTRSRTFMVGAVVMMGLCWITLRPDRVKSILLAGTLMVVVIFAAGTLIKINQHNAQSMSDNLRLLSRTNPEQILEINKVVIRIDYSYRLAGFELPAAILSCLAQGTPPMYGAGLRDGMLSALPGSLRPTGNFGERTAIRRHFAGRCLRYDDSSGVPLVSGIADWGMVLGLFIYAVMALYYLGVWRVMQSSPRLFIAFLMVETRVEPVDLFWEDALFTVRAIGFAWLILWLLNFILMPRWWPVNSHNKR
jgi:hypothetical protein